MPQPDCTSALIRLRFHDTNADPHGKCVSRTGAEGNGISSMASPGRGIRVFGNGFLSVFSLFMIVIWLVRFCFGRINVYFLSVFIYVSLYLYLYVLYCTYTHTYTNVNALSPDKTCLIKNKNSYIFKPYPRRLHLRRHAK